MADNFRKRRLELPGAPKTDDPTAIQKYLNDIRRLTMDEFNRLSGDFFDFRQEVVASATIPLASVAAITVEVTAYTATFTWENPVQPQGTPSHVRFRIAEFGDTWAEYEYPQASWTAYGLNPNTAYTFQMQLVRRAETTISFVSALRNCPSLPVQVESLSEIRSRSFTTATGIGVPTDPGDGTSVIPVPNTNNPGPVGGAGCWWEWQIQIANQETGEWEDTIYSGSAAGNIGNIVFDVTVLDSTRQYRFKYREVCNGVPGPWLYGPPFTGGGDWLSLCGGNDPSPSIGMAPYSTADLFAIPYGCFVEGEGLHVREYLSGVRMIPGIGFSHVFQTTGNEWALRGAIWDGVFTSRLFGTFALPAIAGLDNTSDLSIAMTIRVIDLPNEPPGGFGFGPILNIGNGRIVFTLNYNDSDNWGITVTAPREIGGNFTLSSPLVNPAGFFDGVEIVFTSDANGTKSLWVDGVLAATDTTNEEIRLDGMTNILQVSGFSYMHVSKLYGWSEVIEVPSTALNLPPAILALSPLSYWTLAGDDADTLNDFGSLGIDLTNVGMPLNVTAGLDGFSYPQDNSGSPYHFVAADNIAYEPRNAGGLTVVFLIKGKLGGEGASSFQMINKATSLSEGTWRFLYGAQTLLVRTIDSSDNEARRATTPASTFPIDTWNLVVVRMADTAGGFPAIRVGGVNTAVTTTGSGTTNTDSAAPVRLYGHGSSVGRFQGTLAHVAIFAGQLTDANCEAIEAAAIEDGWTI